MPINDSINIDFNVKQSPQESNTKLNESLDKLTNELSSFKGLMNKFITSQANFNKASDAVNLSRAQARTKLYENRIAETAYKGDPKNQKFETDAATMKIKEETQKANRAQFLANASQAKAEAVKSRTEAVKSKYSVEAKQERYDKLRQINARDQLARTTGKYKVEQLKIQYKPINTLTEMAKDAYASGDTKTGDRLTKVVEKAIIKGASDGIKNSKLLTALAGGYGVSTFASHFTNNQRLGGQIAQSAMTNPLLSYNYGDITSSVLGSYSSQQTAQRGMAATGIGAAIGGLLGRGVMGAAVGSQIGNFGNQIYSGYIEPKQQAQAQAIGEYVNQANTTSSIQGTNSAAFNILKNRSGYTPFSTSGELDVTKPLALEIAKGAAVYDKNFKSIDKLTSYAISAQIPLAKLSQFGASASQLKLNDNQFGKVANLASTYGLDPTELMQRTAMFRQGGFNNDKSIDIAAKSFQNMSGFQQWQTGMVQGNYLDRTTKAMVGQIFGIDTEGAIQGDDKALLGIRNKQQKAGSKFGFGADYMNQAVLDMLGLNQSTYNLNAPESRDVTGARINPSTFQTKSINLANQTRMDAIGGNFDASKITSDMLNLSNSAGDASIKLAGLGTVVDNVKDSLNRLISGNSMSQNKSSSGATSSSVSTNDMRGKILNIRR